MRSDGAAADVLIIGGGFSGTVLAAQLARRGLSSALIEGGGRAGRGTAYSTPDPAHLLNVIAGRMGAWADKPDDFAEAVAAEGHGPDDFVPRQRYGEYLTDILHQARDTGLVTLVPGDAKSAGRSDDGWTVELADGSRVEGRALVLAQGNQPPEPPPYARDLPAELFVNDPWSEEGRAAIERVAGHGGNVLVIGTGLTMVDVVLSLDERGHSGHVVALSRRGLAPHVHEPHRDAPVELGHVPQGSVTGLLRWLRHRSHAVGWRATIDSLRPYNQLLWQGLDAAEQRRFLRHARPWWDVRRHRVAPQVAAVIARLAGEDRLEVVAGRISGMQAANGKLNVAVQRRGEAYAKVQAFTLAVNCTGPLGSIAQTRDALLASMLKQGLVRPDVLDLGLEVDGRSRLAATERAWAVGPLTKGRFWEITAVPDIRGQLAAVADDIAQELRQ